ncbi:hypothetical protein [Actinophytocola sp.]|uniref:hypothetical protein n=1 Tax=Actinophytocola sp. TaxID=1872138 RepID=UPI002ED5D8AE
MISDEIAGPRLPRSLRSPWRWIMFALSVLFVLTGLATAFGGDVAGLLIGIVVMLVGGWWSVTSLRSGVFVSEESVVERGMSGTSARMKWADVAEVRIGPGPSLLPSRTVVLVGKDGVEDMDLNSLSWYSFRPPRVPRRVARFQKVAALLMATD